MGNGNCLWCRGNGERVIPIYAVWWSLKGVKIFGIITVGFYNSHEEKCIWVSGSLKGDQVLDDVYFRHSDIYSGSTGDPYHYNMLDILMHTIQFTSKSNFHVKYHIYWGFVKRLVPDIDNIDYIQWCHHREVLKRTTKVYINTPSQ